MATMGTIREMITTAIITATIGTMMRTITTAIITGTMGMKREIPGTVVEQITMYSPLLFLQL
jgi:hypothetical protein